MDRKDLEEFEQRQSDIRQRLEEMEIEIAELDEAINRLLSDETPAWQAPEWLKPGWIAMDHNGDWYWTELEPEKYPDYWVSLCEGCLLKCLVWTPPVVRSWETSKTKVH